MTYKKGSVTDLSKAILEFIRQPELLSNLGSRGEEYVREKYDYRIIVKNMESDLGIGDE